ncbi:uncharacterized protein LOC143768767 [Ranitomeya variabilis]|uniref:uncharacterized protein LOC143768767 n=1 Tax=Ranitomeya variabilis TaxID=490064 RepID=UPI0040568AF1
MLTVASIIFFRLQLPSVTCKEARDAFDKWALMNLSNEKRDLVYTYINIKDLKDTVRKSHLLEGMHILATLKSDHQGESSRKRKRTENDLEDNEEGEQDEEDASYTEESKGLKVEAFKRLLKRHPVDINTPPPAIAVCAESSGNFAQYTQDKWRRMQKELRIDNVVEKFRNLPSKQQIMVYMKEQGWQTNIPKPEIVLKAWRPHKSRKIQDTWFKIERLVDTQEWKGLVAVQDHKKGGQSIKTSQVFKKGDIVCDYHGVLMGGREGEEIQGKITDEKCYIFFFREKGHKMCINATQAPCECHSQMPSTFGRLINHSRKRNNLKPVLKYMKGGTIPIILFEAKEDIYPGTELLFDYGVKRCSYGEGEDLNWLET